MMTDILACIGIAMLYTVGALSMTFIILLIKKHNKNKN